MRRRTPAPLSAQQMIRDYLVRVSAAAQKVLPKGDRLLFVGRTRATIEAQVGPIASADADDVAAVLTAMGDPEVLAKQERERLYSARRRGAAEQPAKLWKPDKPGKPGRASRRDAKPDRAPRRDTKPPRVRRTRGSGSRLIRKYGVWPGEPETAEGAPPDGTPTGDTGPGPATSGPALDDVPPADAPLADGHDAGQQVTGGPRVVTGAWPAVGPGTSRPADGNGSAQAGPPAGASEPGPDATTSGPAGANGSAPASIVPGMEPAGEDEPLGSSKLGRPEPLTEAWAFVRKQPLESVSLLLVGVGGLLYPFPVWLIGAAVSVRSQRWDKRDKWLAFTGPVLFAAAALFVMGLTGQGNFFVAFGHATHHFGLLLAVGCLLCAGYLVWRLRQGPRRRPVPPWQRMR